MKEIGKCKGCGSEFEKVRPSHVFCTSKCRIKFDSDKNHIKIPLGLAVCSVCGKTFQKRCSNNTYCTEICREKARIEREKKQRKIKGRIEKCQWCHEDFNVGGWKHTYCSKECSRMYRQVQNRLFHLYQFESDSLAVELAKLKRLGNNYQFSKPHEILNKMYGLEPLFREVKQ